MRAGLTKTRYTFTTTGEMEKSILITVELAKQIGMIAHGEPTALKKFPYPFENLILLSLVQRYYICCKQQEYLQKFIKDNLEFHIH
ncbi:hypothetical protein BH11PAT1_BH11PAT1_5930 [soil metagenome]